MRKLSLFILLSCTYVLLKSQTFKGYQNTDRFVDSLAKIYLKKYSLIDLDESTKIGSVNRNHQELKSYYAYLSFRLLFSGNKETVDSIKIFNLGCHCEDVQNSSLMLVLQYKNGDIEQHLFGEKIIDEDLNSLQLYFKSLTYLKEKYKLEMLDIFIKRRQEVIYSSLYLH